MEKCKSDTITDGFGNYWGIKCPICGCNSMVVIRPGKARCNMCDSIIMEDKDEKAIV